MVQSLPSSARTNPATTTLMVTARKSEADNRMTGMIRADCWTPPERRPGRARARPHAHAGGM